MINKDKAVKSATKKGASLTPSTSSTQIVAAPVKAKSNQTLAAGDNKSLNEKEQELFAECESDIEQNLQGAFVFGYRLEQIRDNRLHRATHTSFAAYCSKRWDFSKSHANRLIQAYLCQKHLKSIKDVDVYVPTKEAQVRFIADLKPEQQVEVAKAVYEAVGDKDASAGDFGDCRQKLFPKLVPEAKAASPIKEISQAKVVNPAATLVFDPKLVSLTQIREKLQTLYNIFTNETKKQDGLNLIGKIQKDLQAWVDWEAKQVKGKEAV